MRETCASQGWTEPPDGFSEFPRQLSNSAFPSKVLVVLLSLLQSIKREAFRTNGLVTSNVEYPPNPPDNPVSVVGSSTEDTFTAIDVS